ncbi:hypothetical protein D3C80_2092270 [compost metagenome]
MVNQDILLTYYFKHIVRLIKFLRIDRLHLLIAQIFVIRQCASKLHQEAQIERTVYFKQTILNLQLLHQPF